MAEVGQHGLSGRLEHSGVPSERTAPSPRPWVLARTTAVSTTGGALGVEGSALEACVEEDCEEVVWNDVPGWLDESFGARPDLAERSEHGEDVLCDHAQGGNDEDTDGMSGPRGLARVFFEDGVASPVAFVFAAPVVPAYGLGELCGQLSHGNRRDVVSIALGGLVTNVGARRDTVNADERPGVSPLEVAVG